MSAAESLRSAGPSLFATKAVAYTPAWRIVAAALKIVSRGGLLVIFGALVLSDTPPSNPLKMMRLFSALFLAPELAAWCVARAFAANVRVDDGLVRIEARDETIEVPLASIASVHPWSFPAPAGGLWITLHSGRRLPRAIQTDDPVALVDAMVAGGAAPELRRGVEHPLVRYSRARLAHPPRWPEHPIVKFVLFSLVPTIPVHRLHQYIAYGGTFGEYYTFGLVPYLVGFGIWWAKSAIFMVLIAAVIRSGVEIISLLVAAVVPSYAGGTRLALEIVQRVLYYVGIPLWLYLRLTA